MRHLRLFLILIFLFTGVAGLKASHLVGGEMAYKYLGNHDYEFTLTIYRDCFNGQAPFDQYAVFTVYNQFNQIVINDSTTISSITSLPLDPPNNCTTLPSTVCTEKAIYKITLHLPPVAGGYTIAYQRCCRNSTITNINNSNVQWGSTIYTSIPAMDNAGNSSPKFIDDPPVVLCLNVHVNLNLGVTELNGDSVYYELCSVYHGGGISQPLVKPKNASPPPYTPIPFLPGYNASNPITSSPPFTINHQTGMLTGTPTQVGQFVFAICASEYRNGNYLCTTRRDFQFNVSNSCQTVISRIEDQVLNPVNLCSGGKIRFKNKSQFANTYLWDFGDSTTLADTSHTPNPVYVYQDTGTYIVRLIANPRTDCADTSFNTFKVFDSTQVSFTYNGNQCLNGNSINFNTSGVYSPFARFEWDFGGLTNLGTSSSLESPKNVSWQQAGTFYVTVTVTDFYCSHSFGDSIDIFPNPVIGEVVPPTKACVPHEVHFFDKTKASGPVQHYWSFGDGEFSNDPNPSHTYLAPGTYTVEHAIKTTRACLDSGYSIYPQVITIYPVPVSRLGIDNPEKTIYDPVFKLSNQSEGYTHTETYLPDGRTLTNFTEATLVMDDTGKFEITHLSFNDFGCSDTLVDTISVGAPFNLYVPNAFTPNGDEINDYFTFKMSGVRDITLEIYNRWGEVVYSTHDPYVGWNGRFQNTGEVLPSGVYTYVLLANVKKGGTIYRKKGVITLIR